MHLLHKQLRVNHEFNLRLKKIAKYEKELNYYKTIKKSSKYRHIENHMYYLECKILKIKKLLYIL